MSLQLYKVFITKKDTSNLDRIQRKVETLMTDKQLLLVKNSTERYVYLKGKLEFKETYIGECFDDEFVERLKRSLDISTNWEVIQKIFETWNEFQTDVKIWKHCILFLMKEEFERAKYNPRNPLGKLELFRRAEEDGILFEE